MGIAQYRLLALRNLVWLTLWIAVLFGTLEFHRWSGSLGRVICGPWGCGPPVAALLGYHAFWIVLLVPVCVLLGANIWPSQAIRLGGVLILVGVTGLVAIVVADGVDYWQSVGGGYLIQRAGFCVATCVDVPLAQIAGAGWIVRRRACRTALANDSLCDSAVL